MTISIGTLIGLVVGVEICSANNTSMGANIGFGIKAPASPSGPAFPSASASASASTPDTA